MSDPAHLLANAAAALADGDPHAALAKLRENCRTVDFHLDKELFEDFLQTFAGVSEELAPPEFSLGITKALHNDEEAVYDAGVSILREQLPEIALVLFRRVDWLLSIERPVNEHAQEVVTSSIAQALEDLGRNTEAAQTLRARPTLLERSLFLRYRLCFHEIMSGDLVAARRIHAMLHGASDARERQLVRRVDAMLQRADAVAGTCALDEHDLRGWHYVLTGGVLTHLSPFGDTGMNGRYAFTQDSHARCLEGLLRLKAVAEAWEYRPACILAPDDLGSRILAQAAAELFRSPLEDYLDLEQEGLIVAYDPFMLSSDAYDLLSSHAPSQVLFAHAARWTTRTPFTPDVVTLLYQTQDAPWDERTTFNHATSSTEVAPFDNRPSREIAADILAAELEDAALHDLEDLTRMARVMRGRAAAFSVRGPRSPLWFQGPVRSSYFL